VRSVALVLLAACGGGLDVEAPREKPAMRLVECTPAQPLVIEVDGRVTAHGRLEESWPGRGKAKRAASVSLGMPSPSGGMMDAAAIRRGVTAKLTELGRCYERELAANPSATRHSVSWRFSITQDGRVYYAGPLTRVLQPVTTSCVSTVLRALTFPRRTAGGTVSVILPLTFDSIPIAEKPVAVPGSGDDKLAWTPFAVGAFPPERATTLARAAERVLDKRAAQLEACFKGPVTGSLRAVLGVEGDGDVTVARAGGLGDAAVEACVAKELRGAKLLNPLGEPAEIACDFARGDAEPWRVTPLAGYGVIEVDRKEARFGKNTVVLGEPEPDVLPSDATYLIVLDRASPGALLATALAWASEGAAMIVALRDGKRAPLYLGLGRFGIDDELGTRPILILRRGTVQACLGDRSRSGPLAEVGPLAARLAKHCKSTGCDSLLVGIEDLVRTGDLVELTSAARRAGFDRVLIGAPVECAQPEEFEEEEEP
jgi:hypothetical protein